MFFLSYGVAAEIVHTADAMMNIMTTDQDGSPSDFPYSVVNCARFTPVEDSNRRNTIENHIATARHQRKSSVVILTGMHTFLLSFCFQPRRCKWDLSILGEFATPLNRLQNEQPCMVTAGLSHCSWL